MRLYLETSTPNFLFVDDAPDRRRHTERLFAEIAQGMHQCWVSALYLEEVERAADPILRQRLEALIKTYGLSMLDVEPRASQLAQDYIAAQAFTAPNRTDAEHVAAAVLGGCEVVVSWNFRHIVRAWTIQRVTEVNLNQGLPVVVICTPEEVSPE